MTGRSPFFPDRDPDPEFGIYDTAPLDEADLWFLQPSEADDPDHGPALFEPRQSAAVLFPIDAWAQAQAQLAAPLAELAALFGALDERLRAGPEGWRHRLALLEIADLGWWTGARLPMDRLALWVGLRQGAVEDDAQDVLRAGWAVRRLSGAQAPSEGGWEAGLQVFLGRAGPDSMGHGKTIPEALLDMSEMMESARDLHPVTQSAILFHGWRMLAHGVGGAEPGLSKTRDTQRPLRAQGETADVEAAVLAARHGAKTGRGAALFLPLALSGPLALRGTGTEDQRLSAWISGATQATMSAFLHLDRLRIWEARAREATADLSGRTPPALIAALAAWPMISAPLAENLVGASRAAVQRNLDRLAERGLIREVTGQGRFRVWAAKI